MIEVFRCEDIDRNRLRIQIDFLVNSIKITGQNRKMTYRTFKNKNTLFNYLKNCVGNIYQYKAYSNWLWRLENKYKEVE